MDWLGTPTMAYVSILTADWWQWTPFVHLIAAGGFAALEVELLEAAQFGGAGLFQISFHHALPMLSPYLAVALVVRTFRAFETAYARSFDTLGAGWLMKGLFEELPPEIEEASMIEGATPAQACLPVAGIVALAILCLQFSWAECLLALALVGPEVRRIPQGPCSFIGHQQVGWGQLPASAMPARRFPRDGAAGGPGREPQDPAGGVRNPGSQGMLGAKPKVGTVVRPASDWNLLAPRVPDWLFDTRRMVGTGAQGPEAEMAGRSETLRIRAAFDRMAELGLSPELVLDADAARVPRPSSPSGGPTPGRTPWA